MKHQTPDSMKFKKLQRRLGGSKIVTIGTLELLWISTQKNAPEGDIGKYTDEEIAIECDWEGDPGQLIEALVETGWLDKDPTHRLIVHDWSEHCPAWVKRQLARHKKSIVTPRSVQNVTDDHLEATSGTKSVTDDHLEATPNLTQPNLTQPKDKSSCRSLAASDVEGPPKAKKVKANQGDVLTALAMIEGVRQVIPNSKNFKSNNIKKTTERWAEDVRLIREQDKRTHVEIKDLFDWANRDAFWRAGILSPKKLREKWDQLEAKRSLTNGHSRPNGRPSNLDIAANFVERHGG